MSSPQWVEPSFEFRAEVELPEGWAHVALSNLGAWSTGNTPSKSNVAFWNGTTPWISPKDMKVSYLADAIDHVTERAVKEGGAAVIPPNAILFVVRGMILAHTFPVGLTTREATFNQDMRAVVPTAAVHPPYLLRALECDGARVLGAVREATHGTLRLESETLQRWPVPLAPLSEQHRIVTQIEALLEQVNRAKGRLERVPLILRRFRQSVLAVACSGELTREWRESRPHRAESRTLMVGEPVNDLPCADEHLLGIDVPDGWTTCRVDAIASIQNGRPFPSREYGQEGVRLLRPGNLHVSGVVRWTEDNTACLPIGWLKDASDFVLGGGELVMNLTAQSLKDEFLGRVCLKHDPEPALLNQRIARIRALGKFDVRPYLFVYFKSSLFRSFVNGLDTGSLIRHMHSKDVARHAVLLPPPQEQNEIVRRVRELFALADAVESRVKVGDARAQMLPQAILSKAFAGELVPTEAELARAEGRTCETAEELLERVSQQSDEDSAGRPSGARRRGFDATSGGERPPTIRKSARRT